MFNDWIRSWSRIIGLRFKKFRERVGRMGNHIPKFYFHMFQLSKMFFKRHQKPHQGASRKNFHYNYRRIPVLLSLARVQRNRRYT